MPTKVVAEGKTQIIRKDGPLTVLIESKDDITAGDGLKHDVIVGKARLSTATTCRVFELLKLKGIPTHYIEQVDELTFRAWWLRMYPFEMIARRIATGSYLKRYPRMPDGTRFNPVLTEFFYKNDSLSPPEAGDDTENDPFLVFDFANNRVLCYKPKRPIEIGLIYASLLTTTPFAFMGPELHDEMSQLTADTFMVLEEGFHVFSGELQDFKIELGLTNDGRLVVGDVLNNDSWRLRVAGQEVSKETYRQNQALELVKPNYEQVAALAEKFASLGQGA